MQAYKNAKDLRPVAPTSPEPEFPPSVRYNAFLLSFSGGSLTDTCYANACQFTAYILSFAAGNSRVRISQSCHLFISQMSSEDRRRRVSWLLFVLLSPFWSLKIGSFVFCEMPTKYYVPSYLC